MIDADLLRAARLRDGDSTATFDTILRALAEPGTIRQLPDCLHASIPATAWLALALADVGVSVAVVGTSALAAATSELIVQATGASLTDSAHASIVVVTDLEDFDLDAVPRGSALAPEDAAAIALPVLNLNGEDGTSLRLTGPGIDGHREIRVEGLANSLLLGLGRSSGTYPSGVDVWLLTEDGRVAALPRSTNIDRPEV